MPEVTQLSSSSEFLKLPPVPSCLCSAGPASPFCGEATHHQLREEVLKRCPAAAGAELRVLAVPPEADSNGVGVRGSRCPVGWEFKSPWAARENWRESIYHLPSNLCVVVSVPHLPVDGCTIHQLPSWKPAVVLISSNPHILLTYCPASH